MSTSVSVSVRVAVDPRTAFDVFTQEIDMWWEQSRRSRFQTDYHGTMRFEPGVGGRLIAEYEEPGVDAFEIGEVRVWEPGARLVVQWRAPNYEPDQETEIDVRFEAVEAGTKVTVEHRGWDSLPPDHPAKHGLDDVANMKLMGSWWLDMLDRCKAVAERGRPGSA